jgi:hypothetical protein
VAVKYVLLVARLLRPDLCVDESRTDRPACRGRVRQVAKCVGLLICDCSLKSSCWSTAPRASKRRRVSNADAAVGTGLMASVHQDVQQIGDRE